MVVAVLVVNGNTVAVGADGGADGDATDVQLDCFANINASVRLVARLLGKSTVRSLHHLDGAHQSERNSAIMVVCDLEFHAKRNERQSLFGFWIGI